MESSIEIGSVLFVAFILSVIMTGLTRRYSIRKKILDVPNERSSHLIPTPRGGGLAIISVFLLATIWLGLTKNIDIYFMIALVGGGFLVAAMGYYDDLYNAKARIRICVHFMAATWGLYWLGGFPALDLGTWKLILNWQGPLLALVGIVWCINLYNFMDGIDGLAGMQGFFISFSGSLALYYIGDHQLGFLLAFLAAALLGFTIWNWPPAKIFLGDVGSGFLGYVFAIVAIFTANQQLLPVSFWVILLGVFLCDATFTLIYRGFTGQKWYAAHREHAYQKLILLGASHKQITLSIFIFNLFIIFPLSLSTILWPKQGFWLLSVSIITLFIIWYQIRMRSIHNR